MAELSELEAVLGHHFAHPALLEQALTHASVRHEQQTCDSTTPAIADNERLEFLGDAIVGMVVAEQLYRRYPELNEGDLTRLRAALVSRRHLGLVGTGLQLGSYLQLGRAEERNGGRKKPVLLANCMEALIGALYMEGGLEVASAFVQRTVTDPYLGELRGEMLENRAIGDYKTALQELLQARHARQPEYLLTAESGPDHRKRFVVQVQSGNGARAQGEGSTKKRAEQEAARTLYEKLKARASEAQATAGSHGSPTSLPEEPLAGAAPAEPAPTSKGTFPVADASPDSSKEKLVSRNADANFRAGKQLQASGHNGLDVTGKDFPVELARRIEPCQASRAGVVRNPYRPDHRASGKNPS